MADYAITETIVRHHVVTADSPEAAAAAVGAVSVTSERSERTEPRKIRYVWAFRQTEYGDDPEFEAISDQVIDSHEAVAGFGFVTTLSPDEAETVGEAEAKLKLAYLQRDRRRGLPKGRRGRKATAE